MTPSGKSNMAENTGLYHYSVAKLLYTVHNHKNASLSCDINVKKEKILSKDCVLKQPLLPILECGASVWCIHLHFAKCCIIWAQSRMQACDSCIYS